MLSSNLCTKLGKAGSPLHTVNLGSSTAGNGEG